MFVEFLQVYLPIVIYILLIVILIVGIILVYKAIKTMDKVDKIVGSVSDKVESLNGLFNLIDFATDKVTGMTDRIVDFLSNIVTKIIHKKKNKVERKEEE